MQPLQTLAAFLVCLSLAQGQSRVRSGASGGEQPLIGTPAVEGFTGRARPSTGQAAPTDPDFLFISATTLTATPAARKAYERASRAMGGKRPDAVRAAAELEKAVSLYPSFAAAWFFLGGVRLVLADADSARRAFESALAADPKFPYPYVPLAALELHLRRYAEAARLAESALKLDHRLVEAHYYRALANSNLGRYGEARQSIQAIVDRGDDRRYPGVHAMLAVILTQERDFLSAAKEYRRFLELDPDSPAAAPAREYLAKWRAAALIP